MRTPANRHAAVGFNMTPMIDVVFLLIIFFLVASHFSRQEKFVEVDLPEGVATSEAAQEDDTPRLTLSIPEAGRIFVGSRELRAEELRNLIQAEKLRAGSENFQLRIRAGRKVPYEAVQGVLLAAAKCGIYDIQFAVMP